MSDIEQQAEETIRNLEHYERNWHIFKAMLYIFTAIVIIVVFYLQLNSTTDDIKRDNATTRGLICQVSDQAKVITPSCKK